MSDIDLANAVENLSRVLAEVKTEIVRVRRELLVNRKLIKRTAEQVQIQHQSDQDQQQEIDRMKRVLVAVVAAIGISYVGGEKIARTGEEDLAKFFEMVVYFSGAGIATATVTQKPKTHINAPESESDPESETD